MGNLIDLAVNVGAEEPLHRGVDRVLCQFRYRVRLCDWHQLESLIVEADHDKPTTVIGHRHGCFGNRGLVCGFPQVEPLLVFDGKVLARIPEEGCSSSSVGMFFLRGTC
jgi:hypothetical protein